MMRGNGVVSGRCVLLVTLHVGACYGGIDGGASGSGIEVGPATNAGESGSDPSQGESGNGSAPSGGDPSAGPAGDPSGDPSTDPSAGPSGDPSAGTDSGDTSGDPSGDPSGDTDEPPPPIENGCDGYSTRYWDCCKAHCGWDGNVPDAMTPVTSCNQADAAQGGNYDTQSSCNNPSADASYTCFSMAPWAVGANLAYGFAAVPSNGDICGRCYQLEFTGSSHDGGADPGSAALDGKTMIVQAINIGFDVGGGQFDLLIPGGGVGAFDACTTQWGVGTSELGATYGGILSQCKQDLGWDAELQEYKDCVSSRCASVFDGAGQADLFDGCAWFVDWFEAADNPNVVYQEIECPQSIVDVSGMDRRPLDDVSDACG